MNFRVMLRAIDQLRFKIGTRGFLKSFNAMSTVKIEFTFDVEKTVQIVAMFLKLHGDKPMKYLALLKMLYMADRISLKRINQPLTGDKYVSMKYGPVLSSVYDLIKDNKRVNDKGVWRKHITTKSDYTSDSENTYEIRLTKDPGDGELSEEEEEIIKEVYRNYGKFDRFDLAEITHDFPEWQNPLKADPPKKAIPIDIIDILKNVGKTNEEIEYIREIAARESFLNTILN